MESYQNCFQLVIEVKLQLSLLQSCKRFIRAACSYVSLRLCLLQILKESYVNVNAFSHAKLPAICERHQFIVHLLVYHLHF